jgi:hypothetical protein
MCANSSDLVVGFLEALEVVFFVAICHPIDDVIEGTGRINAVISRVHDQLYSLSPRDRRNGLADSATSPITLLLDCTFHAHTGP